jgi:hypothetical protein
MAVSHANTIRNCMLLSALHAKVAISSVKSTNNVSLTVLQDNITTFICKVVMSAHQGAPVVNIVNQIFMNTQLLKIKDVTHAKQGSRKLMENV